MALSAVSTPLPAIVRFGEFQNNRSKSGGTPVRIFSLTLDRGPRGAFGMRTVMARFKIGELARAANVPRDTIRYYERTGLLSPPERTSSGYRLYDQSDVNRMRFIRAAQSLDFTLVETKSLLELQANDHAKASDILTLTLAKLSQAELKVARLNRIREILQNLADSCPQDAAPNACPILDFLSNGDFVELGSKEQKTSKMEGTTTTLSTRKELT